MNAPPVTPPGPGSLQAGRSGLLVIDLQQRLVPHIGHGAAVAFNAQRLATAAQQLSVPAWATEQYPQGLGPTLPALAELLPRRHEKRMFSCRECAALLVEFEQAGLEQIVVAGVESHVCVLQSALDLLGLGWDVFLAVDALGSRAQLDHETALRRLETAGCQLTTTESVLFEWCETSDRPEFKSISALVKQSPNT